jgi:acetoin utilization protein AcuB
MLVSDVMTTPVKTVAQKLSAREAAASMREAAVLHLVVVDDGGRVVGVLSDRDLRAAQPSVLLVKDEKQREKALSLMKVQDVMVAHPHTVRPEDPVREVLTLMRMHKVGSVPVVNDQAQPIGIVTGVDIIELALKLLPPDPPSRRSRP